MLHVTNGKDKYIVWIFKICNQDVFTMTPNGTAINGGFVTCLSMAERLMSSLSLRISLEPYKEGMAHVFAITVRGLLGRTCIAVQV